MRATLAYKQLPYNPALKERAKALRKAGVLHEVILWQHLKNKQLNNLDFDRQKVIGNYIVDFYCAEKSVVIEVDGASHIHKQPADAARDAFLAQLNVQVIRIAAHDVLNNINSIIELLQKHDALQFPSLGGMIADNKELIYATPWHLSCIITAIIPIRAGWVAGYRLTTHPRRTASEGNFTRSPALSLTRHAQTHYA